MPLHPVYIRLTGATRVRSTLFGRSVVQVETQDGAWHDASLHELHAIGFETSSTKSRQRDRQRQPDLYRPKGPHPPAVPPPPRTTGFKAGWGL